ncbi:MAG: type II/IV secretion system protein, partial [Planctomycetaceae bacterium]
MAEAEDITTETKEYRQKALREELTALLDVVGPAQLVELLLERSFHLRATDIHLDPFEDGLRIRLRVDGLMHEVLTVPPELAAPMLSRVKLLAGMNITEKRFPQDGHISRTITNQHRDVRVGSGPTMFGERIVLRLMPDNQSLRELDDLGLEPAQVELLKRCVRRPYGLIVSAGPVGSGKTATIYSCLELANDPSKSVLTIEDPVERRIAGIAQIQVETKIGFGFSEALRGVLRQDPNVMLVGEIRDADTAQIAA